MINQTKVTEIIKKWYHALALPREYDEQFYHALECIPVSPTATVEDYDAGEENGKKNFLYFLYFCERMEQAYAELAIPHEIFLDTVQDLVRWTRTWSDLKGELYLGEISWLKLIFSLKIIKLGRLQFERTNAHTDVPSHNLKKGDHVLSIHIPATGPLDKEECLQSLDLAKDFFAKFYPDYEYKYFTCYSWLLDPTLTNLLKAGSNILQFQTLFDIVDKTPSPMIFCFIFRWKITPEEALTAKCKSSLHTAVQEQAKLGRQFYEGYGVIEK